MSDWKLGKDLIPSDTILDPVTFDDLILALKCNWETITPAIVQHQFNEILEQRLEDARYLVGNNMAEIIALAKGKSLKEVTLDDI